MADFEKRGNKLCEKTFAVAGHRNRRPDGILKRKPLFEYPLSGVRGKHYK